MPVFSDDSDCGYASSGSSSDSGGDCKSNSGESDLLSVSFTVGIEDLSKCIEAFPSESNWLTELKSIFQIYCDLTNELKTNCSKMPQLGHMFLIHITNLSKIKKLSMVEKEFFKSVRAYIEKSDDLTPAIDYKKDSGARLKFMETNTHVFEFLTAIADHLKLNKIKEQDNKELQTYLHSSMERTENSQRIIVDRKKKIRVKISEIHMQIGKILETMSSLSQDSEEKPTERNRIFKELTSQGSHLVKLATEVSEANREIILHLNLLRVIGRNCGAKIDNTLHLA